jgi:hypothetical protein
VPGDLSLPTTPTTLAKTQATLTHITQNHTCQVVSEQLTAWQSEDNQKQQAASAARKARARNKRIKTPIPSTKMPTPEPKLPSYCADGSGAG